VHECRATGPDGPPILRLASYERHSATLKIKQDYVCVQIFVARKPVGNEIVLPSLIYCSAVELKKPKQPRFLSVSTPNLQNDFLNLEISNLK